MAEEDAVPVRTPDRQRVEGQGPILGIETCNTEAFTAFNESHQQRIAGNRDGGDWFIGAFNANRRRQRAAMKGDRSIGMTGHQMLTIRTGLDAVHSGIDRLRTIALFQPSPQQSPLDLAQIFFTPPGHLLQ